MNPLDVTLYQKQWNALRGFVDESQLDENGLGANEVFYGGAAGG